MALERLFSKAAAATLVVGVLALVALASMPERAKAQSARAPTQGWSVCNETSYVLEASTGRPDGRAIVVQGWTRLRPGECRLAVGAPLARGTHYLYARTSAAHRGGRRQWGGDAPLCVDPGGTFSIENPPQCANMGLEERRFRRVQINRRDSWRTSFSEASAYTLSRARQFGIQRLLNDAGYEITSGRSGADPRRIAQAIQQFRVAARLQPNASEEQLIDALEQAARRRSEQVGLTLCNRTHGRVWTAMARRRGEGWESRGWWPLAAGGCVRTLDESLLQEVYYVYASLETPEGPRFLAAGGEPFCTSPARFSILGREDCASRFYDTDLFSPISARNRTGLVVEFAERDFLEPNQRPRQSVLSNAQRLPDVNQDRDVAGRRPPPPAAAPGDNTQSRPPQ